MDHSLDLSGWYQLLIDFLLHLPHIIRYQPALIIIELYYYYYYLRRVRQA